MLAQAFNICYFGPQMINARKSPIYVSTFFLLVFASLATNSAFAGQSDADSNSVFGLPVSTTSPSEVVGSLPYTNQWISEKTNAYLYVTYNSSQMGTNTITVGQYTANFGNAGYSFPGIDFFSHLTALAGPESKSPLRDFSLWGRYSLGFANRDAQLSAAVTPIDGSVEKDSLLIFSARIGLLAGYERLNWFRPYAGIEVDPYFFRNTSGISGAEEQGGNFNFGPVIGAHFPVFFSGKGSILAEYRRVIPLTGSGQIYSSSNNYTAGMGLTF
jgi:hypothetical protein